VYACIGGSGPSQAVVVEGENHERSASLHVFYFAIYKSLDKQLLKPMK
jgi:hypothetical protein